MFETQVELQILKDAISMYILVSQNKSFSFANYLPNI